MNTKNIEEAFREGYKEGYQNGQADTAKYEFGGGSTHPDMVKRSEDEAWAESEAYKRS